MSETKNNPSSMTLASLHDKYGDAEVMVVPRELCCNGSAARGHQWMISELDIQAIPMYRYEAELDTRYRQIIPYCILLTRDRKIFMTERITGDERLQGMCSIGTGGHMEPSDNSIYHAAARELEEEVGYTKFTFPLPGNFSYLCYIADDSSSVNTVHLGLVFVLLVDNDEDVAVKEKEKLRGKWVTLEDLRELRASHRLESWSEFVVNYVLNVFGEE